MENIFIEQAEYIDEKLFKKWHIDHPDEKILIKKLSQNGAKLITGPRGCGKTTLMLKTYYGLSSSRKKTTLGIYVNFKTSLKIEPLYRKNTNASYWFNQWLLLKIYQGLFNSINDLKLEIPNSLLLNRKDLDESLNQIELGRISSTNDIVMMSVSLLEDEILKVLEYTNRKHCILLLDDAAHAFSEEQQHDFFEFFRLIKSRVISPKAAIYPGITNFSSSFHIGHDAEEIDVWIKPEKNDYYDFMLDILKKRLPKDVYEELLKKKDLLMIIIYASFGIPRSLLNIVRALYKDKSSEQDEAFDVTFNRKEVGYAINQTYRQTFGIFNSLRDKLPIYKQFIDSGEEIFNKMIELLKEYNKDREIASQSVTIAIRKPLPAEVTKVLGFFQYAGLIMHKQELSKGEKGVFELYNLHYAALVERNVFKGKKSIKSSDISIAISTRDSHAYKRVNTSSLMEGREVNEMFSLSLPPCSVCGTPRLSEHTKFCGNCGNQLKSASIFEELVKKDISELPLTERRVRSIKENSKITTIKDILIDTENRELRGVPQIGPYWANKILSYAEEFIG